MSQLIQAAEKGDLPAVRARLAAGDNVNAVNQFGSTALHYAIQTGRLDVVRELIQAGADPTLKNKWGETSRDVAKNNEMRHLLEEAERAWQAKQQAIASLMR